MRLPAFNLFSRPQGFLYLALFLLTFHLGAEAGDKPWVEIRSAHFRVLSDSSERNARHVAREFEQMRWVFATSFPNFRLDSGTPLVILAAQDGTSLKALLRESWQERGTMQTAGLFVHGREKRYALVRLDMTSRGDYGVVYHEYVHSLVALNFRWLPSWLNEGLAEFYSNTSFEGSQIYVGRPNRQGFPLRDKPLMPLETLLSAWHPPSDDADRIAMFYAESWALTHYLLFSPDMGNGKRLSDFMRLLTQGEDPKKAFSQAIGDPQKVEKDLANYVYQVGLKEGVLYSPAQIDEKQFASRTMSLGETEAELADFHMRRHHTDTARQLAAEALRNDSRLGLPHETLAFMAFQEGNDQQAAHEFASAYELDKQLHLSLYFKTMLAPAARSDAPADRAVLRESLQQTLKLNSQFVPAYVELAMLNVREGELSDALAIARRVEQLDPAVAGYHLLSARIMLRMGRRADATTLAKFVAERWQGPDHDEAVAIWSSALAEAAPGGPHKGEVDLAGTQSVQGELRSAVCQGKEFQLKLAVDGTERTLAFRMATAWIIGFSDTVWYGPDHFTPCHHVEGMQAVVRYRPATEKAYTGDVTQLELREDLPASPPAKGQAQKLESKESAN